MTKCYGNRLSEKTIMYLHCIVHCINHVITGGGKCVGVVTTQVSGVGCDEAADEDCDVRLKAKRLRYFQ